MTPDPKKIAEARLEAENAELRAKADKWDKYDHEWGDSLAYLHGEFEKLGIGPPLMFWPEKIAAIQTSLAEAERERDLAEANRRSWGDCEIQRLTSDRDRLEAENAELKATALEYNDLLRSAHSIALRHGADTNWKPFVQKLDDCLKRRHTVVQPLIAALNAGGKDE